MSPNVLLLVSDDHRGDVIAALGEPVIQTPNWDALVQRGACFTRARHQGGNSGAVCVPTRAALYSGRGIHRASVDAFSNDGELVMTIPPDAPTLGETFRGAGYASFFTGKWHNDPASLNRSFEGGRAVFLGGMSDHYSTPLRDFVERTIDPGTTPYTTGRHSSEVFVDEAIRFLDERPTDRRPFFLCVAFKSPHDPRQSPEPYASMYDPAKIPLPPNFMAVPPFDHGDLDVRDEELAAKPRDPEEVRQHLAEYFSILTHQDAQIGRLIDRLRQRDELDQTIVAYTADHGLALGCHGLMGKQNLYEPSLRIPMILNGPGVPAGWRSDAVVQSIDLYPTLCDLAGVSGPPGLDGISLQSFFTDGDRSKTRRYGFAAYRKLQRMVTDGRWKLIRTYRDGGNGTAQVCLFDLLHDPHELHNLAYDSNYGAELERLGRHLKRWLAENRDPLHKVAIRETLE